jgi:cytosine/adenosine deaminase-related metal-dependent hydrolase
MIILVADYIYTPQGIIQAQALAFDTHIKRIAPLEELLEEYPDAKVERTPPYSVIYPGFINTHVHLEFSANKTTLKYGSFMPWLDSVIANRDDLMQDCNNEMMAKECESMLQSGITTFGAISSFGLELEVCQQTPQKVIFFNELIGSNPAYADVLYGDFLQRVEASQVDTKKYKITPAIAIHSPYSVHPILVNKAISLAKENSMPLTAHLLESPAEREWLESGSGEFREFFSKYFNTTTPVTSIDEFINAFETYPTHFVHATVAKPQELEHIQKYNHSIAHCPRSNRYLGCGKLDITILDNINLPYTLATDGLSSNDTLSIFDEMRAALMLHSNIAVDELAVNLIDATTKVPAEFFGLDCGMIEVNKQADLVVVTLPDLPKDISHIPLWSIIHTHKATQVYIDGERYV